MTSQEEIFDFFQTISIELEKEGYPILDNIIHPFPGFKFKEQIIEEEIKNKEEDEKSDVTDED